MESMRKIGFDATESHPTRGAWIEIPSSAAQGSNSSCRTPHGVRGLKSVGV